MTGLERTRVLIVDDEPLARRRIRRMLSDDDEVEVIGDCGTGREALTFIRERSPDLVFLDVQMPEMDGFDVLKAIEGDRMPLIVFVTAHDQYALKAFEVYALDYLLKPFDRRRFDKALQRAKARLRNESGGELGRRTLSLLEELKARGDYQVRLVIKEDGRVFFLRAEDIDWIEAEGKYVRLHAGKDAYLVREAIGNMEAHLDPKRFARIHRSTIVNIDRIRELEPWFHNEYRVVLRDGTRLMLSRGCRKKLSELLGAQL